MTTTTNRLPAPVCRAVEDLFHDRIQRELALASLLVSLGETEPSQFQALGQVSSQLSLFMQGLMDLAREHAVPFSEVIGHAINYCDATTDNCIELQREVG